MWLTNLWSTINSLFRICTNGIPMSSNNPYNQAMSYTFRYSIIVKIKGEWTYSVERREEVFDEIAGGQKLGRGEVLRLILIDQDKGPPWTARTWSWRGGVGAAVGSARKTICSIWALGGRAPPGVQNIFFCPTPQFLSAYSSNKVRMLYPRQRRRTC